VGVVVVGGGVSERRRCNGMCLYLQSHIIGIVLFLLLLLMMSSFVSFSVSVGLLVVVFVHFFVETFVNQNQYKPGIYETTDDWT